MVQYGGGPEHVERFLFLRNGVGFSLILWY